MFPRIRLMNILICTELFYNPYVPGEVRVRTNIVLGELYLWPLRLIPSFEMVAFDSLVIVQTQKMSPYIKSLNVCYRRLKT